MPEEGVLSQMKRFSPMCPIVHKIVEDLVGMLAARGKVDGAVGIAHLLDIYRRLAEAVAAATSCVSFTSRLLLGLFSGPGKRHASRHAKGTRPTPSVTADCRDSVAICSTSHGQF